MQGKINENLRAQGVSQVTAQPEPAARTGAASVPFGIEETNAGSNMGFGKGAPVFKMQPPQAPQHTTVLPSTQLANTAQALAPLDKKIIPKPKTYSGNVREYVSWNDSFKDFLQTQDRSVEQ